MEKNSILFTAGWAWDGKVGSHLVDEMGREYTICWRYVRLRFSGMERDGKRAVNRSGKGREIGREHRRKTQSGMVANMIGRTRAGDTAEKSEM